MSSLVISPFVGGPRIVPYGQDRSPADRLANGRLGFRVTQMFGQTLTKWGPHAGLDVGNYQCGDAVFAGGAGKALAWKDSAGALCVTLDLGNGWKLIYAHLDAWTAPVRFDGAWHAVAVGQQIGIVGDTGLGAVCHLHVEAHYSGLRQDPWPLLEQNQEGLVLQGRFVRHTLNRRGTLRVATNFREGTTGAARVLNPFGARTVFYPVVEVQGESVGGIDTWYGCWLWVDGRYRFGYFHASGVEELEPHEASGITDEQVSVRIRAAVTAALSEAVRLGAASVDAMRRLIP